MAKRVLVPINLLLPTPWAAFYGVQLASRLKAPMTLMAVSPGQGDGQRAEAAPPSLAGLAVEQRLWLEQVVGQCQREGVNIEIFFSTGLFFEEIIRFIRATPAIQFIVLGVPNSMPQKNYQVFAAALKHLHREFGEEILLVREKGEITRLAHLRPQNLGREK
jgi:hypothetical protein